MLIHVDEATRKAAKAPHELAMVNLIVFNLLIGVALLAGSMAQPDSVLGRFKWVAIAAPLTLSLMVIGLTWLRASRPGRLPWFVAVHWRLSAERYRLLIAAYVLCGGLLSLGWLGATTEAEIAAQIRDLPPAMQEMQRHKLESQHLGEVVWARIGVVPLLIAVMVSIMLESGAIYQAGQGEVSDSLARRLPPPTGLERLDEPAPP
ncbi:hypothetical protein G3480_11230 [Thiorhodococcus mannitoliphagus]|uniref:Uncharacterized protein n=1 Tax=Thiorhodococcus mannitoliphagus TaxID=329406 RepID=A0A6P1DRJ6_9GAMM|nr:hypothetical protein [Thiorhodococcus mannitoliphagus]NEX20877.1 hypothetical protein [Thiorhodococcus mannitoliphagus]